MSDTEGWTPTDEDLARAMRAPHGPFLVGTARDVLSTIGPIVARERRAAQVEALREVAEHHRETRISSQHPIWPAELDAMAAFIERGAL